MKNLNNWLDKPITWRDSLKVSGLTMVFTALGYAIAFKDDIVYWVSDLSSKVKNKSDAE